MSKAHAAKRVAVVVIHGIGGQQPDFADPLMAEVNCQVNALVQSADGIAWQSVYWDDLLVPRQRDPDSSLSSFKCMN